MEREPFALGEWYHCYSRGVDKRRTFQSTSDYRRFIQNLYLTNSDKPIHRSDFQNTTHEHILQIPRGKPLVAIGAFCLMPNHFHLLLQEKTEGGISKFMRSLGTAYAMYFNIKHDRVGNLFVKPFRSRRVEDDRYLRKVAQYIHLNPIEIFEPGWKEGKVVRMSSIGKRLKDYPYSSLPEYMRIQRSEKAILDQEIMDVIADGLPPLSEIIADAADYYTGLSR